MKIILRFYELNFDQNCRKLPIQRLTITIDPSIEIFLTFRGVQLDGMTFQTIDWCFFFSSEFGIIDYFLDQGRAQNLETSIERGHNS